MVTKMQERLGSCPTSRCGPHGFPISSVRNRCPLLGTALGSCLNDIGFRSGSILPRYALALPGGGDRQRNGDNAVLFWVCVDDLRGPHAGVLGIVNLQITGRLLAAQARPVECRDVHNGKNGCGKEIARPMAISSSHGRGISLALVVCRRSRVVPRIVGVSVATGLVVVERWQSRSLTGT